MSAPPDVDRIEAVFTSRYGVRLFHTAEECPPTLFDALICGWPHIPVEEWTERAQFGGVFLNGYEVKVNCALPTPCKIEYYEPKFKLNEAHLAFPRFDESWILHRDTKLLVVFKPAGLPSLPAKEQTHFNLRAYLERYLGHPVHMPSRLDMSTSGILVVSTDPTLHQPLQKLYTDRTIQKKYLANTAGNPPAECFENYGAIGKDPRHPVLRKVVTDGGKTAHTFFKVLGLGEDIDGHSTHLIEAQPKTGRTHQIRVHLADLQLPIVGDSFYNGPHAEGLRLLSYAVHFNHPSTGQALDFTLPQQLAPAWARGKY